MPGCCVIGCNKRSEQGYRMFLLPQGNRNAARRSEWILNIGRPNLSLNSYVCEAHFTADQFENRRRDNKRFLKWNAIPTVFDSAVTNKFTRKLRKQRTFRPNKVKQKKSGEDINLDSSALDENVIEVSEMGFNGNSNEILNMDCETNTDSCVRKSSRIIKRKFIDDYCYEDDLGHPISEDTGAKRMSTSEILMQINSICRLCGKCSNSLVPIFCEKSRKKQIPVIISDHLSIEVDETDKNRPLNLCNICFKNLTDWKIFFDKCKSLEILFSSLANKIGTEKILQSKSFPEKNFPSTLSSNCGETESDNVNSKINVFNMLIDHNYCPIEKIGNHDDGQCKIVYPVGSDDHIDCDNEVDVVKDDGVQICLLSSNEKNDNFSSKSDVDELSADNFEKLSQNEAGCNATSSDKKQYRIGITLFKSNDCNQKTELDFKKLKSILINKVNWLFQSICNDEDISKALVNPLQEKSNNSPVLDNYCEQEIFFKDNNHNNSVTNRPDCTNVCSDNNNMKIFSESEENEKCNRTSETSHSDSSDSESGRSNSKIDTVESNMKKLFKFHRSRNDLPYLCSDCGHLLKKRKSYQQHRRVHHIEKKCDYCNLMLSSYFDYRRHVREFHEDVVAKITCEVCGAKFIKNERFQRHKLVMHNIGEYFYCNECGKKCASKQQLHCHKSDKHKGGKNLCPYCGEYFSSYNSFASHMRSKHASGKLYTCTLCNKKLTSFNSLVIHTARHANRSVNKEDCENALATLNAVFHKSMYSCLVCGVKVTDVDMLKQHMSYHSCDGYVKSLTGMDSGKMACHLCDKYFEKEKELALHRFYFHDAIPFACRMKGCDELFWRKFALVVHHVSVHKTRPCLTCSICSETFQSAKLKQHHIKTYHSKQKQNHRQSIKMFSCTFCDKGFCSEVMLKTHMAVHFNIKKYHCHLCGKSFKLKLTLSKHLRFHARSSITSKSTGCSDNNDVNFMTAAIDRSSDLLTIEEISSPTGVGVDVLDTDVVNKEPEPESVMDAELFKICSVYKCPKCDALMMSNEELDIHLIGVHGPEEEEEDLTEFKLNDDMLTLTVVGEEDQDCASNYL